MAHGQYVGCPKSSILRVVEHQVGVESSYPEIKNLHNTSILSANVRILIHVPKPEC